jgi:hypothetical protein
MAPTPTVQALIEQVHGVIFHFAAQTTRLQQMAAAHQARVTRQEQLSAIHLVPPAKRVSSLADLHRQHLTTAQAATRPGLLPRRLLPCHRSADGTLPTAPSRSTRQACFRSRTRNTSAPVTCAASSSTRCPSRPPGSPAHPRAPAARRLEAAPPARRHRAATHRLRSP